MSETTDATQATQENTAPITDASAGTSDAHGATTTEDSGPEPFDAERAKAKIHSANNEAKNLRERLRQAEAQNEELRNSRGSESGQEQSQETQEQEQQGPSAEERATAAESRALRLEIAMEKGLTAKQAARLVGHSREELLTDADELLESFGGASGSRTRTHTPSERVTSRQSSELPEENDPLKLAAKIRRG